MVNKLFYRNTFDSEGRKLVTTSNTANYSTLNELYFLFKQLESDKKYNAADKHHLPYVLTTSVKVGKLAGQRGYFKYLFLDIDEGMKRKDVETMFKKYKFISYYSYSNGIKGKDARFRLIFALDRPYTSDEVAGIKKQIIAEFPYADINSFKANTLMYAPVHYDGMRDPKIRYNRGANYSFSRFIKIAQSELNKEDAVKMKKVYTSVSINNSGYDKEKQQAYVQKVLASYKGKGSHTTNNWLFKSAVSLKSAGLSDNDILNLLEPYEGQEHKGKVSTGLRKMNVTPNPYFYKLTSTNKRQILSNLKPKEKTSNKDVHIVKEYLSEISKTILDIMDKNKQILLQADTNLGKTYFFSHLNKRRIVIFCPTRNLVDQLVSKLKKEKRIVSKVMGGINPDFTKDLIISTYDGISKFFNYRGIDWLNSATMVVDEAHNLTIASNHTYRQDTMRMIKNAKAYRKIYMTATPIDDTSIIGFKKVVVQKEVRRAKDLVISYYDDKTSVLLKNIKDTKGTHIIYWNNKKELAKLEELFISMKLKTQLITSDTVEKYESLISEGKINKDTQIVLTTSVLGEGFRIKNDISALHIMSHISPELVHQMSERPEKDAIKTTFVYVNNKKSLVSKEFNTFSSTELFKSLTIEAENIIKYNIDNEKLLSEMTQTTLEDINKSEGYTLKFFNEQTNKSFRASLSENAQNLVYEAFGRLNINEIGINFEVYNERTLHLWNNIPLFVQELLNYNFTLKRVEVNVDKLDKELKKTIRSIAKKRKDKETEQFNNDVNTVISGGYDIDPFIHKYIGDKIEELRKDFNMSEFEAGEVLKAIGSDKRKFNDFKRKVYYANADIKLRNKFNENRKYTTAQINSIINEYREKHTGYATKLSKTKTTQLFNDLFFSSIKYDSMLKTRVYTIINTKSYKSIMNINITLRDVISENRELFHA